MKGTGKDTLEWTYSLKVTQKQSSQAISFPTIFSYAQPVPAHAMTRHYITACARHIYIEKKYTYIYPIFRGATTTIEPGLTGYAQRKGLRLPPQLRHSTPCTECFFRSGFRPMIYPLIFTLFTYRITDENTTTPVTSLQNSCGLQLTPGIRGMLLASDHRQLWYSEARSTYGYSPQS